MDLGQDQEFNTVYILESLTKSPHRQSRLIVWFSKCIWIDLRQQIRGLRETTGIHYTGRQIYTYIYT